EYRVSRFWRMIVWESMGDNVRWCSNWPNPFSFKATAVKYRCDSARMKFSTVTGIVSPIWDGAYDCACIVLIAASVAATAKIVNLAFMFVSSQPTFSIGAFVALAVDTGCECATRSTRTVRWGIGHPPRKPSCRNTPDPHCGRYNYRGQVNSSRGGCLPNLA